MFLFSCFIFWWQWGRDKEVLIILSLSPLIRVNLLENSGTAGPLQVNDDLKHWVGAVEMIPRPGPRADSRGRAGLPLFLHIFHSFIHSNVYHLPYARYCSRSQRYSNLQNRKIVLPSKNSHAST